MFAEAFADVPSLVCYAMKANSNQAVLRTLARLGAGMDVVSEGELRRARAAGVPGQRITFSGVGKTARRDGARAGRGHPLLQRRVRARAGGAVRGRRRARPDRAHRAARQSRTSTPRPTTRSRPASRRTSSASRSRTPARSMPAPRTLPGIRVTGVDMHIGSQITDLQPFDDAFALLADFVRDAARRRPRRSTMSISAAASAFPIARTTSRRPIPSAMPRSSSATRTTSAARWCSSPAG